MAKVIMPFRDRVTWVAYGVGDEYEGPPERVQKLSEGGFVQSGLITHKDEENGSDGSTEVSSDNLEGLTVAELRQIAEERGIDVPKRATKPKLLEILGA